MRSGAFLSLSFGAGVLAVAFAAPASATILVNIDKDTQRMTVTVDGAQRYVWPVSTGRAGYDTPSGTFRPNRMDADHLSQEWDNAPMPHTIFFDLHGHAIHGFNDTRRIGSPASHGCVRLAPQNAATLYALVEAQGMKDTTVVVSGHTPTGSEIARRGGVPVEAPAGPPVEIAPAQPPASDRQEAVRLRTTAAAHIVRAAAVRRHRSSLPPRPGRAAAAHRLFSDNRRSRRLTGSSLTANNRMRNSLTRNNRTDSSPDMCGLPMGGFITCSRAPSNHTSGNIEVAGAPRASHRLLEFEHEIVDRHGRLERDEVAGVLGVAPEVAFGDEPEAGRLDLLAQRAFLDAMQRLADGGAVAVLGEMIGDHQNAAGLERREHFAVHLGAIDVHVGGVVVVEQKRDQIEIVQVGRYRIVERPRQSARRFSSPEFSCRASKLVLARSLPSAGYCA